MPLCKEPRQLRACYAWRWVIDINIEFHASLMENSLLDTPIISEFLQFIATSTKITLNIQIVQILQAIHNDWRPIR